MSQIDGANDYKIIKIETDVKVPEDNIIPFTGTAKKEETKTKRNPYMVVKRVLDIILAVIMLVVLSPILLITSLAIKIDSKGPVLFKQKRTGKGGKEFMLYKFRSMSVDNDVHDFSKADNHTRVGNFIRKTSLDELPQLINIIKGDMSFIGPRPWIPDYFESMNEDQRHRYDVLPGITGLAQAMGRNNITIEDKINYDLQYVNNCSFFEDAKVIFKTVQTVVSKDGCDAGKSTIQNELEFLRAQNNVEMNITTKYDV